jgi:uncharacterized integral membrane protein
MMNRFAGWLVLVPLCAVLVVVALANRQPVAVNLNPFAPVVANPAGGGVPLFLVLYAVLLIGVLLGGAATWITQSVHRRRERHWRREAQHLSAELDRVKRRQANAMRANEIDDMLDIR